MNRDCSSVRLYAALQEPAMKLHQQMPKLAKWGRSSSDNVARSRITLILSRPEVLVSEFHAACNLTMMALIVPGFVLGLDRGPCDIFLDDNVIAGKLAACLHTRMQFLELTTWLISMVKISIWFVVVGCQIYMFCSSHIFVFWFLVFWSL